MILTSNITPTSDSLLTHQSNTSDTAQRYHSIIPSACVKADERNARDRDSAVWPTK